MDMSSRVRSRSYPVAWSDALRPVGTGVREIEESHRSDPVAVVVVVPVRDDADGLRTTLRDLDGLPTIVVDDGSAVPLQGFGHPTIRHDVPAGPGAARNSGWRACPHADLVAFVDAETQLPEGWATVLAAHFADPHVAAVAPRIRPRADGAPRRLAAYEAVRSPHDRGPSPAVVGKVDGVRHVPGATLMVRRAALERIGGFDESLRYGEDIDLIRRITTCGDVVRYDPSVVVTDPVPATWVRWLRKRYAYGTSVVPLARRRNPVGSATTTRAVPGQRSFLRKAIVVANASRRTWWLPVLLLAPRRARRALLIAGVMPIVAEWIVDRPELDIASWTSIRLLDDLVSAAGVWSGLLKAPGGSPDPW